MTISTLAQNRLNHQADAHSMEQVLVGIVTRNRCGVLPKAIESAIRQQYPRFRVAVLDDGSEDETPHLRSRYPAIRWIRWEESKGYLEARNHLMRDEDADFYLSLDDDAWFISEDEISVAVQHMEMNPRLAAVAFDVLSPDHAKPNPRAQPRPTHTFIGCGHILRLSAVRQCGFYVPGPGYYGSEEKDLCIRLLDRNWEIDFLPGVHIWHDKTTVARDVSAQHGSGVCNDLAFAARRCPFPLILGIMPLKLINHLRFSTRNHLLKSCFQGLGLFFTQALNIWRSRDPVRASTFLEFIRRSHKIR
ncbi:MAG: glycosyltransferase [Candidatus Sulfotelmatobacter sp.]